jgi:hypothetical protein
MLGRQGGLTHGAEEGGAVNQNGETVRTLDPPNIGVGHKDGHADCGPGVYLCRAALTVSATGNDWFCPLLTAFEDRLIDSISARRDNPATA